MLAMPKVRVLINSKPKIIYNMKPLIVVKVTHHYCDYSTCLPSDNDQTDIDDSSVTTVKQLNTQPKNGIPNSTNVIITLLYC
jgi:hypothetical protein